MLFKQFKYLLLILLLIIPINALAITKYPIDTSNMSIVEINKYLEKKIISSENLVNLYLEKISEYNEKYKVVTSLNKFAINDAKKLDEERENGNIRSLLHGIPILVKDNIDVYGLPTTAGSSYLKENMPKQNAYVVQKLIDAGAIVIGKTNMSEFAFMASSSSSSYGTVKNAYNPLYSSYGSSGGSAVGVALNFVVAAIGTDTNASVRLPAAANNLIGYRPTLGLVSRSGVLPYDIERDTVGPITKTVEDAIIIMNIINGYDKKDNKSINQDKQEFIVQEKSINEYTIGIPKDFFKGSSNNSLAENKETYKEIINLMQNLIDNLEKSNVKFVYLDNYYTIEYDNLVMNSYSGYLFCNAFNEYIKGSTGSVRSFQELANKGAYSLGDYLSSCGTQRSLALKDSNKQKYRNYIENIMKNNNLDAIMYPSSTNKLLKINTNGLINLSAHASSTIGFPAITLPLGFDSDCLPYGIELMGNHNKDNDLLNLALLIEQNTNINKECKISAPELYEIDESIKILLTNYDKMLNKKDINFIDKKWMEKSSNYFKEYTGDTIKANELNENYATTNLLSLGFKVLISVLKIFFIIISLLLIFLIIRKKIRKKIKYRKKRMKR